MIQIKGEELLLKGSKTKILADMSAILRQLAKDYGIEEVLGVSLLAIHSAEVPDDELEEWLDETEIEFEYHGLTEGKAGGTA